jgi:hypothetical protein
VSPCARRQEGELAAWVDNEAAAWAQTTGDEDAKEEKLRTVGRLAMQANALRAREVRRSL